MLAYQAGSEEAFDRLVEAYSPSLYALFTRFLGPAPEREDLVQEVFLRVIRARARYEPTARFSTWLYRIAFNLAVNRAERGHASAPMGGDGDRILESWGDPGSEEPVAALERGDTVAAVRAAIARLPAAQRLALILAKYDGLSYAEIAGVMGSSEKAIKSMVHRARETLRARLAPLLQQEST